MSSSKLAGRCWFCDQRHFRPVDPPEHILGAAIGAELTTDAVARSCNERVEREVEQPLAYDLFIAFDRVFYDIRDRRGSRPPNPPHRATFKDGTPVQMEMRELPWRATVIPQIREEGEAETGLRQAGPTPEQFNLIGMASLA